MSKRDFEIVRAWNHLQRNWWAHKEVFDECAKHPRRAWRLLGCLADAASSKELIGDLGAGPLEDFIRLHAPKYISQIEARARKSRRFRQALSRAYLPIATDAVSVRLFKLGVIAIDAKKAKWQAG
jgi:hypothetical protein